MDAKARVLKELRNENVLAAAGKAAQDRGEPTVVQDALYKAADAARGRKLAAFGELRKAAKARLAQLAGALAIMIAVLAGASSAGENPAETPAEKFCREHPRGRDFIADASCPSGRRLVTCTPLGPQLAPCDAVKPGVQPAALAGDEWVPCSDPAHRIPVMCQGAGHGRCQEGCPTKCSEGHLVACSCCRYVPR